MKVKPFWMVTLVVAGLGVGAAISGCQKEPQAAEIQAAEKAAAEKAAADKAAANKAAADKAVADKAAADKAAAQAKAEGAALPPDLVEMKSQVTRMTAQIDTTMAKLETLCATTGDLDEPSEAALKSIEELDAEIQALKGRGDQMRNLGAAYFEEWEKQLAAISTPEVAAIATKRKDELAAKYAEVLSAMQESRVALDAYWADMTAIKAAVDEGLTPDAQKLLAPKVQVAKQKAGTLKDRVQATFEKVNQVSLIYTSR